MGKGMKISSLAKYFCFRVINTEASGKALVLVVALVLSVSALMAQDAVVRPSKAVAQEAWDRGNYDLAYQHFNGLLLLYSRDPLYKYYTGACLVQMEREVSRAVSLLGSAINSSVNLKSVPAEVWFFYGRSLQMEGNFDQAAEAYRRFAREAGKKSALEYDVQKYLDQCSQKQGAVYKSSTAQSQKPESQSPDGQISTDKGAVQSRPTEVQKALTDSQHLPATSGNVNKVPGKDLPATSGDVNKVPGKDLSAVSGDVNKVPGEYFSVLGDAVQMQHLADSLGIIADVAVRDAGAVATENREEMLGRAKELTRRAAESQTRADSLFRILDNQMSTVREQPPAIHEEPTPAYLLSRFEVRSAPAYSDKEPVPIDADIPTGLIYSIQIAAFRNKVSPSLFRGLYPVYGRIRKESGTTYFYAGLFRRLNDARQAIPEVRSAGFPDAFAIALMDGTQISMERAALLEGEWAEKPIPGYEQMTGEKKDAGPAVPMPVVTLSFRAEVMRIVKPVKPEVVEKLELLAGTRGLDMHKNSEGETVFLIGNFITFESAEDYVSLLIRNGYSAARVAAYVGLQEIPVETAQELLNKLPDD